MDPDPNFVNLDILGEHVHFPEFLGGIHVDQQHPNYISPTQALEFVLFPNISKQSPWLNFTAEFSIRTLRSQEPWLGEKNITRINFYIDLSLLSTHRRAVARTITSTLSA